MVARSGIKPMYQNSSETVKYVDTANTSQSSGERNCGQIELALGIGSNHQPSQIRPMWIKGNMPAQITAKIVIASAARLIEVRQRCRSRNRIAEIKVPAWPIPIQKTKLVISHAQATGIINPQTPTPVVIR